MWPHYRDHLSQREVGAPLLNPLYEKNPAVLVITVTALNVTLWKSMYLRRDARDSLTLPGFEAVKRLKDTNTKLKQELTDIKLLVTYMH